MTQVAGWKGDEEDMMPWLGVRSLCVRCMDIWFKREMYVFYIGPVYQLRIVLNFEWGNTRLGLF